MSRITVYPVEGRTVPDPERGDTLPAEGREVPHDAYWARRLRASDVTQTAPKAATKAKTGDIAEGSA